jgi:hypothetical protein
MRRPLACRKHHTTAPTGHSTTAAMIKATTPNVGPTTLQWQGFWRVPHCTQNGILAIVTNQDRPGSHTEKDKFSPLHRMQWNKQNNVQKLRIIIHGRSTKKNRVRETFKLEDWDLQLLRPETKKFLEVLAKTDRVFGHKSFDVVNASATKPRRAWVGKWWRERPVL